MDGCLHHISPFSPYLRSELFAGRWRPTRRDPQTVKLNKPSMQPGQLNLLQFFQLHHYFLIGWFIPWYSLFQLMFYHFNAGNKLISIHNHGWFKINPKPLFHWQVLSLVTWNKGKFYHRISSVRMEVALLFSKSGQFCSNLIWWMMTARFIQLENFSCISTRGKNLLEEKRLQRFSATKENHYLEMIKFGSH